MKKQYLLLLFLICFKTSIGQNFNYLGTYSSNGTPNYLESPGDVVSVSTLELIDSSIPETFRVPVYNPHYISSGYDTDLLLNAESEVFVTFISEGAGFRNVLGYYTYDAANPPSIPPADEDIVIIFPNASALGSGGGLRTGDKVSLGTFPAGTGIGWVLLSNGWNGSQVGYGYWRLFSNPAFNPESDPLLRQHNVLISDAENEIVILGFEDINREASWCDHDFNDAVFYVTASDFANIATQNVINSATSSNVYSSNAGGFESNGNLAGLMAKRSIDKVKNTKRADSKNKQKKYNRSLFRSEDLGSYFPETGLNPHETPYIATSLDLVNYANALDVFSVDYYAGDKRVSAGLVTTTEGIIYDHGKTTCDRLNNSELLDVRTVILNGHKLIFSILKRDNGNTEYAISFSVREGEGKSELYSLWNINSYPTGNYKNFQVWGESMSQVSHLTNFIIDKIAAEKVLVPADIEPTLPEVFVKSAYYHNQELHMEIINKSGVRSADIAASLKRTEQGDFENFETTVALSGEWNDHISVKTGYLFDVGLSFKGAGSDLNDALYLADGPWGVDYDESLVSVDQFIVHEQIEELETNEELYQFERAVSMSGTSNGIVNLFRTLKPGDLTMNIESFETITFSMKNNVPIEVALVPADLQNWDERFVYTLSASEVMTSHELSLADFTSKNDQLTIGDMRSVVFSVQSPDAKVMSFDVEVSGLALKFPEQSAVVLSADDQLIDDAKVVGNYPNPFEDYTNFTVPEGSTKLRLVVYDMSGKLLINKALEISEGGRKAMFKNEGLKSGIYRYILMNQNSEKYSGSFLIR